VQFLIGSYDLIRNHQELDDPVLPIGCFDTYRISPLNRFVLENSEIACFNTVIMLLEFDYFVENLKNMIHHYQSKVLYNICMICRKKKHKAQQSNVRRQNSSKLIK